MVKSVVKMKAFEHENPVRICDIEGLVQMSEFFFPVHNFYQSYVSVTLQDCSQKKKKSRYFSLLNMGPLT